MTKCFWESQNMIKSMYDDCVKPVCAEFGLASIELDILMYLETNPDCCTATDIVNLRKLTKSHVSSALKNLSEHGYVEKYYRKGNRKTIYLKLTDAAEPVVAKGKEAQKNFASILFGGFSEQDLDIMHNYHEKLNRNVKDYFGDKNK